MKKSKIRMFTNIRVDWHNRKHPLGFALKLMLSAINKNPLFFKVSLK